MTFCKTEAHFSMNIHFLRFLSPCSTWITSPIELLLLSLSRYKVPEKMRAQACLVFEISTETNLVHDRENFGKNLKLRTSALCH